LVAIGGDSESTTVVSAPPRQLIDTDLLKRGRTEDVRSLGAAKNAGQHADLEPAMLDVAGRAGAGSLFGPSSYGLNLRQADLEKAMRSWWTEFKQDQSPGSRNDIVEK
jgi:hypothetical protein